MISLQRFITSLYFGRRRRRGTLAYDLEDTFSILRAVVVDLLPEVRHERTGRHGHSAVRVIFRTSAYPPRSRKYRNEPVVRVEVRVAHVVRSPLIEQYVQAGFVRVAGQNGYACS